MVFAVLVVFLRALVAPLYFVASSVLALAASIGLTVHVFQVLLGYGEFTYFVPFIASVLLVALGSDYAFLMSVGLLIDAFLVRTLLVPALIALVGPASAWPRRLRSPRRPHPRRPRRRRARRAARAARAGDRPRRRPQRARAAAPLTLRSRPRSPTRRAEARGSVPRR